jgi:hypothetical protein
MIKDERRKVNGWSKESKWMSEGTAKESEGRGKGKIEEA